ncbi:MAG TPA: ABC transporter permease subunit [Chthoniobacterales bacterium]|nr:ABC transporter permease subunit [Chthoniobacterales bacterium]
MTIHLWESFRRAMVGLFLGGSIGFVLGLMNGLFTMSNRVLDSSLQMIRNIPHLALIPLVIRWSGIGEQGKLFLIILGVFFPIYLNTMHGIRSTDPRLLEMGKVYGLGPWSLLTRIILPGALPSILVGLRYALGIMWLTLIVAETIASDSGIGFMVMNARDFLQFDVVVFGILLYALLGKAADTATRQLERWFLRWNPNYLHA